MSAAAPAERLDAELRGTRYRFVRYLASDRLGDVAIVEHEGLKELRRMRLVSDRAAIASNLAARLRTDARKLTRISHPHLVRVVDFGTTRGQRPFIVSELCEAETLEDWLERAPFLPVAEALEVGRQVLLALERLAESGLRHGDFDDRCVHYAPAADGSSILVRLVDFGLCDLLADENTTDDVHETARLLYRLVTGRDAGEKPAPASEVALQHVSMVAEAVLMRAVAPKKEDRFESAAKLREAIEVALLREQLTTLAEAQAPPIQAEVEASAAPPPEPRERTDDAAQLEAPLATTPLLPAHESPEPPAASIPEPPREPPAAVESARPTALARPPSNVVFLIAAALLLVAIVVALMVR